MEETQLISVIHIQSVFKTNEINVRILQSVFRSNVYEVAKLVLFLFVYHTFVLTQLFVLDR